MKKYIGLTAIAVLSSALTIGGYKYLDLDQKEAVFLEQNQKGESNSPFKFISNSSGTVSGNLDFTIAAEKTLDAVVHVNNFSNNVPSQSQNPFDQFFNNPRQQQPRSNDPVKVGSGSGVIISEDGYIVTNNHVIDGADKIEISLNNKKTYKAKLIGTDPNTDLALLKIEEAGLPFLSLGNSDNVKVGEWVLAVGNPFNLTSTVTAGIVSAKGRSIDILKGSGADMPIENFIQTDAAVNPGNSGGALVDSNGVLIGINSAIYSRNGGYMGYSFAIPTNLVKKVISDLMKYGVAQRGLLGVGIGDLNNEEWLSYYNHNFQADLKKRKGLLVTQLSENGGAKEAGIKMEDIILKVDNKEIQRFQDLSTLIGKKRPGDKVAVVIERNGKEKTIMVTLKNKEGNTKLRKKSDLSIGEKLGASFETLSKEEKENYGINYGIKVTSVKGKKLREIGVTEGAIILKINKEEIKSVEQFNKIVKKTKGELYLKFVDARGILRLRGIELN